MHTEVVAAGPFHVAEDYHQKWYLRQRGGVWLTWLWQTLPDEAGFRDSTAAARLNGFFGGHGEPSSEQLSIDLGLSRSDAEAMARAIERR